MTINIVSLEQVSDWSMRCSLSLPKRDYCLFGFLLESVEGLGIHSANPLTGGIDVLFSKAMRSEFEAFISGINRI